MAIDNAKSTEIVEMAKNILAKTSLKSYEVDSIDENRIRLCFMKGTYHSHDVAIAVQALKTGGWALVSDQPYGDVHGAIPPNRYLRFFIAKENILSDADTAGQSNSQLKNDRTPAQIISKRGKIIVAVILFVGIIIGARLESNSPERRSAVAQTYRNGENIVFDNSLSTCDLVTESDADCHERAEQAVQKYRQIMQDGHK